MPLRLFRALAAATLLAGALSACTITSEQQLVPDNAAVNLLPTSFILHGFEADDDIEGLYVAGEDPERMSLDGVDYVSEDGTTRVRFAALPAGDHVISVEADDSFFYGLARYSDNVLALHLLIDEDDPTAFLQAEARGGNAALQAALANIEEVDGGLVVSSEAALSALLDLQRSGRLASIPLISFIASDANAKVPAKIFAEGNGWRFED